MNNRESLIKNISTSRRDRRILIWAFCLCSIILSGIRDVNKLPQENDTIRYQAYYEKIKSESLWDLIKTFTFMGSDYKERDMGYPVFVKVTQLLCGNFTFFMFITAALFIIPFGILIEKYVTSKAGVILCFMIFFALFTNIVNSFMRQAITIGIFLLSNKYIFNNKWKKYYLLIILAFTIHNSAVVAAPFYFLPKFASNRKLVLSVLMLTPLILSFSQKLLEYFVAGTVYNDYIGADAVNPSNYIMFVFGVSILTYIFFERIQSIKDYEVLVSGVLGSLLLLPLVFLGNSILRISFYYVILLIPLIPAIIDNMRLSRVQRVFVYVFSVVFWLYYII